MSKLSGRRRVWDASAIALATLLGLANVFAATAAVETPRGAGEPMRASAAGVNAARAEDAISSLPLAFEPNRGQTDARARFLARAGGYVLFLTADGAVMTFGGARGRGRAEDEARSREFSREGSENKSSERRAVVRMRLEGASRTASALGLEELPGRSNYFAGDDPRGWQRDVPQFARVQYSGVYRGVDVVYYGRGRQLEYDFLLAPGADPSDIRLAFEGADGVRVDDSGDLLLERAEGTIRQLKPVAYQEREGVRTEVWCEYVLTGEGRVGFRLGDYDPRLPLVIDPVLAYSSFLGGSGFDRGNAVAVDSAGNAYVTGQTASADFPVTPGAFQNSYGGGDAFVTKVNASGTALVYSTYVRGATGYGIAVDSAGSAYVTGEVQSTGFPITKGSFQTTPFGWDTFILKLDPTGSSLAYSSRFGGSFDDFGRAVAVDSAGSAYITGWTSCRATPCDFPVVNAFQPNYGGGYNDAFVTKMNASGTALVYSTYLGGGSVINATDDWGQGIAVDASGSAYVVGSTYAPDFPLTQGAYASPKGGLDVFVTKFSPSGTSLVYSARVGGGQRDDAWGVAVDAAGSAYVTGYTESYDNPFTPEADGFPTTPGAFQTAGSYDAFVTKLSPSGSALDYSTYLGGSADVERGWAVAVDAAGNAYVAGDTKSSDLPVVNYVQPSYNGGLSDAFLAELNASGTALVFSTYLGGSSSEEAHGVALDAAGNVYATGVTSSPNFPVAGGFQRSSGGGLNSPEDGFVVKLSASGVAPAPTPTPTPTPTPAPSPTPTPAPAPTLSALVLSPSSVTGGASAQATVTLSAPAPAGGAVVTLASGNTSLVTVPPSVTVAGGATSASFGVTTKQVTAATTVQVSASYGGTTQAAALTLNPAADRVTVQAAQYTTSKKELRVEASSTGTSATLRAYVTATGALIGTLSNTGGGKYKGQFAWATNPQNVTVRSSLGGSASLAVSVK